MDTERAAQKTVVSAKKIDFIAPFLFAALAVLMCAVVIWDQQFCWSSRDDYFFGYLVPFLCAFVVKERLHLLSDVFSGTLPATGTPMPTGTSGNSAESAASAASAGDEFSPPRFLRAGTFAPVALEIFIGVATIFCALLFAVGAAGTGIYGSAAITTHECTFGFIGAAFGLAWFAAAKDFRGNALDLRSRARVLLLLVFPIGVWFVSGPFTFLVDSQIKALLLDKVTATVVFLLNTLDFSLVQEGNIIVLPGGDTVGVADACSGIRSMTACVFAGTFLAAIFLHSTKKKICFVAVSVVFALVLNVLRTCFLTLWSLWHGSKALDYDFFGNPTDSLKFTLGTVHDIAGWSAMLITFVMLLALVPVFNLKMTKTDAEMALDFVDDDFSGDGNGSAPPSPPSESSPPSP